MLVNESDVSISEGSDLGIALISRTLIRFNTCLVSGLLLQRSGLWQDQIIMTTRAIQLQMDVIKYRRYLLNGTRKAWWNHKASPCGLCNMINDAKCIHEIISMTATAKAAFNKKRTLFSSKMELNLRKKLFKCYIWSIALYGAGIWTLRK